MGAGPRAGLGSPDADATKSGYARCWARAVPRSFLAPVALALLLLVAAVAVTRWVTTREHRAPAAEVRVPPAPPSTGLTLSWSGPAPEPTLVRAALVSDGGVAWPDAGPPPPDAGPSTGRVTDAVVARLCAPAARAICAARERHRCAPLAPIVLDDGRTSPPPECTRGLITQCEEWVDRHYAGAPDAMALDEPALDRCLRTLEAQARAGQSPVLDPSCSALPLAPGRLGEPCPFPGYPCSGEAACGDAYVCIATPRRGEPCDERPCGRGLVCIAGLCAPPTPHGGACDEESICDAYDEFCAEGRCARSVSPRAPCEYGTDCDTARSCRSGRCERASPDACSQDEDCGRDRYCEGSWEARCERYAGSGEPCTQDRDCSVYLACDRGICTRWAAVGTADVGEACGDESGCLGDLVCVYGEGGYRCRRGAGVGERCEATPCDARSVCTYRVADGHCAPALCAQFQPFADDDGE